MGAQNAPPESLRRGVGSVGRDNGKSGEAEETRKQQNEAEGRRRKTKEEAGRRRKKKEEEGRRRKKKEEEEEEMAVGTS